MPVGIEPVKTQTSSKYSQEKKYKDPLNNWVLKSLSFSNELGACVNEISPKTTFALWIPTFMYLGADIYDKYKNDKTEYSPSRRRALDEAIAQGFTSFIMPAGAIILGQKITSPIGKLISGKLSINARETVYEHTKNAIIQCVGDNLSSKEKFVSLLKTSLRNNINRLNHEKGNINIFQKAYRYMTGYYAASDADRNKLLLFAEENAKEIFELKENLEQNKNIDKIPKNIYNKYKNSKPLMKEIYGEDYALQALKSALETHQNKLIFKNKLIKTLGGIVSLAILYKPMNNLVNNIIMPKYIDPQMDIIENRIKDGNLLRLHVKHLNEYSNYKSFKISNEHGKTLQVEQEQKKLDIRVPEPRILQANQEQTHHQQTSQSHS